jgi:hypothetical protein
MALRVKRTGFMTDGAAVIGDAPSMDDRLRNDGRGGIFALMNHPGSRILVLAFGRDRNRNAGAFRPVSMEMQPGYFILTIEPMLPSIHSIKPSSSTKARLVTRFTILFDQFWTVE